MDTAWPFDKTILRDATRKICALMEGGVTQTRFAELLAPYTDDKQPITKQAVSQWGMPYSDAAPSRDMLTRIMFTHPSARMRKWAIVMLKTISGLPVDWEKEMS